MSLVSLPLSRYVPFYDESTGHLKGYIQKWTNYMTGYQQRYVVLKDGTLTYYRNEQEVRASCRGSICIVGAKTVLMAANQIKVTTKDGQIFTFKTFDQHQAHQWLIAFSVSSSYSSSSIDIFKHLKNNTTQVNETAEKLRDELHETLDKIKNSFNLMSKPFDSFSIGSRSSIGIERTSTSSSDSQSKLKRLSETMRNWKARRRSISPPKCSSSPSDIEYIKRQDKHGASNVIQSKSQQITLPPILEGTDPYMDFCKYAQKFVQIAEKYQCMIDLSFNLNCSPQFISNHNQDGSGDLKTSDHSSATAITIPDPSEAIESHPGSLVEAPYMEQDEFFDAKSELSVGERNTPLASNCTDSTESNLASGMSSLSIPEKSKLQPQPQGGSNQGYRSSIPKRPVNKLSLFKIIKEFVGKDLTRISIPVNYNEPISMLQRAAEALEYSEHLDLAAECQDPHLQICHLAAFVVSSYSSTALRTGKPFNPLLNETFEYDRSGDLGWKTLFEQVTHHPPMLASHTIGRGWVMDDNLTVESNFNMNSITVQPKSITSITFLNNQHQYVWNRVTTNVRNIVMGNLWIEQCGVLSIENQTTGDICSVTFHEHKMSDSSNYKKITGKIQDSEGETKYRLVGHYDDQIVLLPAASEKIRDSRVGKQIWKNKYQDSSLSPDYYFFTEFTCSLNGSDDSVAPTDSRRRPDQRALEDGSFDEANTLKNQLEDMQRKRRAAYKAAAAENHRITEPGSSDEAVNSPVLKSEDLGKAIWFALDYEQTKIRNTPYFKYKGGYWEAKQLQDWSRCPKIFDI